MHACGCAGGGAGADGEDWERTVQRCPSCKEAEGKEGERYALGHGRGVGTGRVSGTLYHTNAENQLEPSLIRLSVHEATFVSITSPNSPQQMQIACSL